MASKGGAQSQSREEAARTNLSELNLTTDEVSKFETAFKDPEFKKMFAEYAAEISDPKNKAESDMYLRQLEYEGKAESTYGKGVQLVVPNRGFAAKTFDKTTQAKVFINVCHTEKCEDATSERMAGRAPRAHPCCSSTEAIVTAVLVGWELWFCPWTHD
jgi:hypothetical protein